MSTIEYFVYDKICFQDEIFNRRRPPPFLREGWGGFLRMLKVTDKVKNTLLNNFYLSLTIIAFISGTSWRALCSRLLLAKKKDFVPKMPGSLKVIWKTLNKR